MDIDPYAVAAIGLNAAANGVSVEATLADLTTGDPPAVALVLVGDLFYDAVLAERILAFLDRCRAAGVAVLIGDPWREFLPTQRLRVVADYPVADFGDPAGMTRPAAVFALI